MHLHQKSVVDGMGDFLLVSGEPESDDLAQRLELIIVDIVALVFGETEQEDGQIGTDSDQHPEAASFSPARPCHPLFDDMAAKIGINQAARSTAATRLASLTPCCRVNFARVLVLKMRTI
jgi:hypothetical protein